MPQVVRKRRVSIIFLLDLKLLVRFKEEIIILGLVVIKQVQIVLQVIRTLPLVMMHRLHHLLVVVSYQLPLEVLITG